jgi:hypothetical protein
VSRAEKFANIKKQEEDKAWIHVEIALIRKLRPAKTDRMFYRPKRDMQAKTDIKDFMREQERLAES